LALLLNIILSDFSVDGPQLCVEIIFRLFLPTRTILQQVHALYFGEIPTLPFHEFLEEKKIRPKKPWLRNSYAQLSAHCVGIEHLVQLRGVAIDASLAM